MSVLNKTDYRRIVDGVTTIFPTARAAQRDVRGMMEANDTLRIVLADASDGSHWVYTRDATGRISRKLKPGNLC